MLTGACHCGAVTWKFDRMPRRATACNCTVCRRYGVLWIYDYEGENVSLSGPVTQYRRADLEDGGLSFDFCPTCGCVMCWRADAPAADGRRRMAVNARLAEPETVAHLMIRHFDGLESWDELPGHAQTVGHMWA